MAKNILKSIIIFIICVILGNMLYGMYKEMSLSERPQSINSIQNNLYNSEKINQKVEYESILEEYKGHKVTAKLTIPKIDLDTYVFEEYDEEAMWICPAKYYGPEPNEMGNFCIAAHNYDKENMFNHIIDLEAGDKVYLSDNKNGKIKYEVYDVYKVKPTDNTPLEQETNGQVELTLITCSDYSSKRIIVKARKEVL